MNRYCEWCGISLTSSDHYWSVSECEEDVHAAPCYCPTCGDYLSEDAMSCSCDKQE